MPRCLEMEQMRAIVTEVPGAPDVLKLTSRPIPQPKPGWVLIAVKAFGLNRSELYTRRGLSPSVVFPRIQGIEAVGIVAAAPDTRFQAGQTVACMMGGMGRMFDGSYAQYTLVPEACVFALQTDLDWASLGALPEMFQTVMGSLNTGLDVRAGETLLIRGGSSSIGMLAARLAKQLGLKVFATTRNPSKSASLLANGADEILIDTGEIYKKVYAVLPKGVDKVLELIGTNTLLDSLQATRPGGIVCMTGILGDAWTLPQFAPMEAIPTGVRLTSYSGEASDITEAMLQDFVDAVADGRQQIVIDRVFELEQLSEAHEYMEANLATGKIVVRVN